MMMPQTLLIKQKYLRFVSKAHFKTALIPMLFYESFKETTEASKHTTAGLLRNDLGRGFQIWKRAGCLPLHTVYGTGTSPRIHYSGEETTKKAKKGEAQINKIQ